MLRSMPRSCKALALALLSLSLVSAASSPAVATTASAPRVEDPRAVALRSWVDYLQSINWPKDLAERYAPRFLGNKTKDVPNDQGGRTVTFDGSRPGLLATVTVVLDAAGNVVGKPVVLLGDVVEAR